MKKILIFTFVFLLILPIFPSARTAVYIDDQASLLNNEEYTKLENTAKQIVDKHSFDLLIVSSTDLGGLSPEEYADGIYKETEFGKGIDRDGLIVVYCFGENKGYCFYPTGIGNKIFTGDVAEKIFDTAYPHFVNTEDYEFYNTLLEQIENTLTGYKPPSRVIDNASLLTDDQERLLQERIDYINKTYNFDAVLVTVTDSGTQDLAAYSEKIYKDGLYGFGEKNDGVLFAISSPSNQNHIFSSGYGGEVFTDYGTETINSQLAFPLSSGDYYSAFSLFLDDAELFLKEAFKNVPFDEDNPATLSAPWVVPLIIILLVCMTAFFIVWYFSKRIKERL